MVTGIDCADDTTALRKGFAGKLAVKGKVHHSLKNLWACSVQLVEEEDDRLAVCREPVWRHEVCLSCLLVLARETDKVAWITHLTKEECYYRHAESTIVLGEDLRLTDSMISYEHDVM